MHFSNNNTRGSSIWHVDDTSHALSSTNQQESTPQRLMQTPEHLYSFRRKMYHASPLPISVNDELNSFQHPGSELILNDRFVGNFYELSEEEEMTRCAQVGGKNDFIYNEQINGKEINVLQGIELHTRVFNVKEQNKIIDFVYYLQRIGQDGQLRGTCFEIVAYIICFGNYLLGIKFCFVILSS